MRTLDPNEPEKPREEEDNTTDWFICEKCHRPVRVSANQCGWCGTYRYQAAA